jgi:mannose/fructose/N-acetylgalactosamine-specific phosphotransferase system component IIC
VLVSTRFRRPIHWTPVLLLMLVASSGFGFLVLAHHWVTLAAVPVVGALGAFVAYKIAQLWRARGAAPEPGAQDEDSLTGNQPVLAG